MNKVARKEAFIFKHALERQIKRDISYIKTLNKMLFPNRNNKKQNKYMSSGVMN